VHAEAGEAEVLRHAAREVVLPVVEHVRREAKGLHARRLDEVHLHGAIVVQAGVKELYLEGELLRAPERLVGPEADVPPLVVAELQQPIGNLPLGLVVRRGRQLLRALADVVEAEGGARLVTGQQQERQEERDEPGGALGE